MTNKEKLIQDVQNLLNSYGGIDDTVINPDLFTYMNEQSIIDIISDLLKQKESVKESDLQWLENFKKNTI